MDTAAVIVIASVLLLLNCAASLSKMEKESFLKQVLTRIQGKHLKSL